MELRDASGDSLALTVTGLQFPDANDPDQRFSWHNVAGSASLGDATWHFTFPALACDESPRVSQWLRGVAAWLDQGAHGQPPADAAFIEPNLRFSAGRADRPTEASIEVTLQQEFRLRAADDLPGQGSTLLRLRVSSEQLQANAARWEDELRPFADPRTEL